MHPANARSLASRLKGRLANAFDFRLVRWMRLGDTQQVWYLKRLFDLLPIDLVVDVGGNEGQFATRLRRQVGYCGPMISAEPVPWLGQRMQQRFAGDRHWALAACALGDAPGQAKLKVMRGHELSSLLQPSNSSSDRLTKFNQVEQEILVDVSTLDQLLASHPLALGCQNIYLKLDVQGYEGQVLLGAKGSLDRIAALQAELSVIPLYEGVPPYHVLMGEIEAMGFQLSFVPAHNYTQVPDMIDFDCHFVSRRMLSKMGYLRPGDAAEPAG